MNAKASKAPAAIDVRFHAEITWLGPILGAPCEVEGKPVVPLACTENPALGKSFCAALVPVVEVDKRFREVTPGAHTPLSFSSDRHGWSRIHAPLSLFNPAHAGVLVVLLYNQSKDLAYYTLDDLQPSTQPRAAAWPKALSPPKTVPPPMPVPVVNAIVKAIADAIADLLDREPAERLRYGLAQLPATSPSEATRKPAEEPELAFALGSCQYPSVMIEGKVAGASYERLGTWLTERTEPVPQCLLLVGDQIYVDGTAGLFDPTSQFDRFVRPYEILFEMKPVRDVLRRLPAFMMMDDHEIFDNWEPVRCVRNDPVMIEGRRSYFKFQRRAGPDPRNPEGDSRHPLWCEFSVNGFPVFMADTRTERTPRDARTLATARIMSETQMDALCDWLRRRDHGIPKIVASPSILLPRHVRALPFGNAPAAPSATPTGVPPRSAVAAALRSDGWDGYPASLHHVLACIAEARVPNVVFVSGDEHLSCVARIELETRGHAPVIVHSVHSSPLFAPFPFANSDPADLAAVDTFDVPAPHAGGPYVCRVRTTVAPPGDGFAVLHFRRNGGGWDMECSFDRADASGSRAARINCKLS